MKAITLILFSIFVTLKLTGHIAWPWIWVLSPLWIYAVIAILIFCAILYFVK